MKIEQLYTSCLAEAAYYIESNGEAVIIDPLRDIETYLEKAQHNQAKIKYVFLTHFHADFLAGHQDLASATGATIVIGPTTLTPGYACHIAHDQEIFEVGNLSLKILHTPGHTTESICILLSDEKGIPNCVFTGDTLFIDDVGRPDLAQKVIPNLTQEKLAVMLYHSLRNKLMTLPDSVIVYPNHGAGSPCGKNISGENSDTMGHQKKVNYGLRHDQTEAEFVEDILNGLTEPPQYFPSMVLGNIRGVASIFEVRKNSYVSLTLSDFMQKMTEIKDVIILDTRPTSEFVKGCIKGSINIDLEHNFAIWLGTVVRDINTSFIIITPIGREHETADRMARVGFQNVFGYLDGGFETWKKSQLPIDTIPFVYADKLTELYLNKDIKFLDVRKESEYKSEHIIGALNIPLDYWWKYLNKTDKNTTYYVYCAGGFRTGIFGSLMKRLGYSNMVIVLDGFNVIKDTKQFEISEYVCPETML